MSEELRRGIPKAIVTGRIQFTEEQKKKADEDFEKILKEAGVIKDGMKYEDFEDFEDD